MKRQTRILFALVVAGLLAGFVALHAQNRALEERVAEIKR